jgi:hypothetical protein
MENEIRNADRTKLAIMENLKTLQNPEMVRQLQASYEANERTIVRLTAELSELQSGSRQRQSLLDMRRVLEKIIANWGAVPAENRRELFEALASYVNVTELDRLNRRMTIHWRDGSTSDFDFRRGAKRVFWSEDELNHMREMVETGVPQWQIMKTFPDCNWNMIVLRYLYHFGEGSFAKVYQGEKKYPYNAYWKDTDEYQAEQSAFQNHASLSVSLFNRLAPKDAPSFLDLYSWQYPQVSASFRDADNLAQVLPAARRHERSAKYLAPAHARVLRRNRRSHRSTEKYQDQSCAVHFCCSGHAPV